MELLKKYLKRQTNFEKKIKCSKSYNFKNKQNILLSLLLNITSVKNNKIKNNINN